MIEHRDEAEGGRNDVSDELHRLREYVRERAEARINDQHDLPGELYLRTVDSLLSEQLPSIVPIWRDYVQSRDFQVSLHRARQEYASVRSALLRRALVLLLFLVAVAAQVSTLLGRRSDVWLAVIGAIVAALSLHYIWTTIRQMRSGRVAAEIDQFEARLEQVGGSSRAAEFDKLVEHVLLAPAETRAKAVVWTPPFSDKVILSDGPGFSGKAERKHLLETAASRRVAVALSRRFGSAVGIAGPRGAGKSELARLFADSPDDPSTVGVFLWAPVTVEPRSFLLSLLKGLCLAILEGEGEGLERDGARDSSAFRRPKPSPSIVVMLALVLGVTGLALILGSVLNLDLRNTSNTWRGALLLLVGALLLPTYLAVARSLEGGHVPVLRRVGAQEAARELLRQAEYVEKQAMGVDVKGTASVLEVSTSRGLELERLPLSEADIVREISKLVGLVNREGRKTVVAIDEIDKMETDEAAIVFLNHLKVVFPIPNCSYIVSVSENAWARFEHRGLPFRDAFDSALDDVIFVDVLSPVESRDLLRRRSPDITDVQALLCHCLSGGLPRDLLRAARHLAQAAGRAGDNTLPTVLNIVLLEDLDAKVRAAELRMRSYDPLGLCIDVWEEISSWRERWRNVESSADALRTRASPSQAPESSPESAIYSVRSEMLCYIGLLHSTREAFAPHGPIVGLEAEAGFDQPLIDKGFGKLAEARNRMAVDEHGSWELLRAARRQLGLAEL